MAEKKRIKVLDKTIDVLMLFLEHQKPLGITEISNMLQTYKSSVHRIVTTLKYRGFIRQDPETKKYWLGSKFFSLGMIYQQEFELQDVARPYLQQLAVECGETVHLAIFDELNFTQIVTIDKIEGNNRLSISPPAGSRTPVHATAVGKVLVAYSSDEIQETVLASSLEKFTKNTIIDRDDLEKELKKIRRQGYAIDNEELEPGLTCFAAPIIGNQGQEAMASFSISGPKVRMIDNRARIIDTIKTTAHRISSELK